MHDRNRGTSIRSCKRLLLVPDFRPVLRLSRVRRTVPESNSASRTILVGQLAVSLTWNTFLRPSLSMVRVFSRSLPHFPVESLRILSPFPEPFFAASVLCSFNAEAKIHKGLCRPVLTLVRVASSPPLSSTTRTMSLLVWQNLKVSTIQKR